MSPPIVPANRGGTRSDPHLTATVTGYRGRPIAEVERYPGVLLGADLRSNKRAASDLRFRGLEARLDWAEKAAGLLARPLGTEGTTLQDHERQVARATGLPVAAVQAATEDLQEALRTMGAVLRAQAPDGTLDAYEFGVYTTGAGNEVAWVPAGRNLGVVLPKNHPGTLALPLTGFVMGYPAILRPSAQEPFTAHRVIEALYAAGAPPDSLYVLSGDHELGWRLLEGVDRGVAFGSGASAEALRGAGGAKVHGPGNSKVYVAEGQEDERSVLDRLEEALMSDGGRGCVNLSQIVTSGDAAALAGALAARVADVTVRDILDERAEVPAAPSPERGRQLDRFISTHLGDGATDVTAKHRDSGRLVERDGATYVRPSVVQLDGPPDQALAHPLAVELSFQYATVVEVDEVQEVPGLLDGSLGVGVFAEAEVASEIVRGAAVEKVYRGSCPCEVDLTEPHEGYLSDHLFQAKAFRR